MTGLSRIVTAALAALLGGCLGPPELRRAVDHAEAGRCADAEVWLKQADQFGARQSDHPDAWAAVARCGEVRAAQLAADQAAAQARAQAQADAERRAEAERLLAAAEPDPGRHLAELWRLRDSRALGQTDLEPRVQAALIRGLEARLADTPLTDPLIARSIDAPELWPALSPALTQRIDGELARLRGGAAVDPLGVIRQLGALTRGGPWSRVDQAALAPRRAAVVDVLLAGADDGRLIALLAQRGFGDPALARRVEAAADARAEAALADARLLLAAGDCHRALAAAERARVSAPPGPALIAGHAAIGAGCAEVFQRRATGPAGARLWWLAQADALTSTRLSGAAAARDEVRRSLAGLDQPPPKRKGTGKGTRPKSYAVVWRQSGQAGPCADLARRLTARLPRNDRVSAAAEKVWADVRIDIKECTFEARLGRAQARTVVDQNPREVRTRSSRTEYEQYCTARTINPATGHGQCTSWGSRPRTTTTEHRQTVVDRTTTTYYAWSGTGQVRLTGQVTVDLPGRQPATLPLRYGRIEPIRAEGPTARGPTHVTLGKEGPFRVEGDGWMRDLAAFDLERYLGRQADEVHRLYHHAVGGHAERLTREAQQADDRARQAADAAAAKGRQQAIAALQGRFDRGRGDDQLDALARLLLIRGYGPRPTEQALMTAEWHVPGVSPNAVLGDPGDARWPEPKAPSPPRDPKRSAPDALAPAAPPPPAVPLPPPQEVTDPPGRALWVSTGRPLSMAHGGRDRSRELGASLGFAASTTPIQGAGPGARFLAGLHLGTLTLEGHFATPIGPLDAQSGWGIGAMIALSTHTVRSAWRLPAPLVAFGLGWERDDIHGAAEGAPTARQSLHIPLRVTVPVWDWVSVEGELRGNIMQFFDDADIGRYSRASVGLTLYGSTWVHLHVGGTADLGADAPLGGLAELMLRL